MTESAWIFYFNPTCPCSSLKCPPSSTSTPALTIGLKEEAVYLPEVDDILLAVVLGVRVLDDVRVASEKHAVGRLVDWSQLEVLDAEDLLGAEAVVGHETQS